MSFNPSKAYANNAGSADKTQGNIADLDRAYQVAILGGEGPDQDTLRDQMSRMKALLGHIRLRAAELVQETRNEALARKDLKDLATG